MLTAREFQEMNGGLQVASGTENSQNPPHPLQEQGGDLPRQLNELALKYDHLNVRYKHIIEERDALSKQVIELRRKIAEQEALSGGRNRAEEIRLLGRLIDEERSLREAAQESGVRFSDDLYARHNRFINAFFSIVGGDSK